MLPKVIHKGNTYNTISNRRKAVKTSKGVEMKKIGKKGKLRRCHGCNVPMTSIAQMRPAKFNRQKLSSKRVSRVLGGTHCSKCVEKKIIAAFLDGEAKAIGSK